MMDELDLLQLASQAELLATVDDVDYLSVAVVLSRPSGAGAPALFCAASDWPQSLPARLAEKEREIAELAATLERWATETTEQTRRAAAAEARIKELEAQLARVPKQNQEAMFRAQAAALAEPATDNGRLQKKCPYCRQRPQARHLAEHIARDHPEHSTIPDQPPTQFVEELGWKCKAKGCMGAHARDLHDPGFCTLHARIQRVDSQLALTNGVEHA